MFHRMPWALLLACLIAWPLAAAEDSKKDASPGETDPKPPVLKGKWTPVGALSGQVKKMTGDNVTLIVEYPDIQQNPNNAKATTAAQKQMQTFQNQLAAANKIKNPAQRLARIQQIEAQMQAAGMKQAMQANNVKTVMKKKDVDVLLAHEIQVRVKDPIAEFDEKGVQKKFTAEELKKLKGPGNLWGYPAESDKIKPGATLQVFLYKKSKKAVTRPAPKGTLAPKDKDEKKDGDKPKDGDEETPKSKAKDQPAPEDDDDGTDPVVKVVYVLQESTQPDKTPKKGK